MIFKPEEFQTLSNYPNHVWRVKLNWLSLNLSYFLFQPTCIDDFDVIKPISRGAFGWVNNNSYLAKQAIGNSYFCFEAF